MWSARKLCNKCWCDMVTRHWSYGVFRWCKNYPACKNSEKILETNKEFEEKYWYGKWDKLEKIEGYIPIDKTTLKKNYQEGYVYVVYFKFQKFYKIWSTINFDVRFWSIASENKLRKEQIKSFYEKPTDNLEKKILLKTYNYETLEKQLHFIFRDQKVYKNEYFDLSKRDLVKISKIKNICGIQVENILLCKTIK